jgi:hypothetical protein
MVISVMMYYESEDHVEVENIELLVSSGGREGMRETHQLDNRRA